MSSVESISALERRLNASVPNQAFREEVVKRLKSIGRTAKMAGFRPGKIPPRVLEQHYGAQVYPEILNDLVKISFSQAVGQHNLNVVGSPQFEITSYAPDVGLVEYSATFEVLPEVVLDNLSEGVMEHLTCELTQTDVDNAILKLRKQRAAYEPADRAAQMEDQVHLDFTGKCDGEIFHEGESISDKLVLGSGNLLPEFEAAIIGMRAGETKFFDLTLPENYQDKEVAGKLVTFTATLNKVESPILPEMDAAFAEAIGIESGDVNTLVSEVQANLQRELSLRLKARNKNTVMDALLKAARFEVPRSLVEQEANTLMKQAEADMASRGIDTTNINLSPQFFAERAENRVKLGLILAYLTQLNDLYAKPDQVRARVNEYAQSYENQEGMVNWYYANPDKLKGVENLLLEENVADWTMAQAKAVDKAIPFYELMGS
jgi:trigger factor